MLWCPLSAIGIRPLRAFAFVVACAGGFSGLPTPAAAQSAENVAVIINDDSPDSQRIGEYYARVRALPASNVLRIRTSLQDTIDRATYTRTIEGPIAAAIGRARLQDRVLYLVLTKHIPLRIAGTTGLNGTGASVDSELTLLYRRMTGQPTRAAGYVDNPYFLGDKDISQAEPFTHRQHDIFLVSRLDGFTADQVIALIDRAGKPARDGQVVLDKRDPLTNRAGEDWMDAAAKRLTDLGQAERAVLETTVKPARDVSSVLGYFSWGSVDPQNRVRWVGMGFVPGAIAASFVSSDARTFKQPPETWVPSGNPALRATWFEGSPESLVGDLIREGVTGVAGHVSDPLLNSAIRPQILFPAYLGGFNLIEAYYLAMPHLSWQTVIVGDPLCAPFRTQTLTRASIEDGPDPLTELPAFFSKRRIAAAVAQSPGVPARAVAAHLQGQTLLARGEDARGRTAVEEAVELAPQYVPAWLQLASLDETAERFDAATDKYRRVLQIQPNNVIALNNLAYAMAVRQHMPAEALPLARRAATQAPADPAVLDTLGWILHLTGDDAEAAKVLGQVARLAPNRAEMRLHAAVVFAAVGARAVAERELAAALVLDPAYARSEEVRQVRAQLEKLGAK
jgi:uncharacterized protein (TIGR03790 family)